MSAPKFSVAICGGGIGGLTAAIAISRLSSEKRDIKIDLYEAAQEFTEIGAGVGMWRRPWKIMKSLGLDAALAKLVDVPAVEDEKQIAFQMRKSDQPKGIIFYDMLTPNGNLNFHRAAFQRCLTEQLDPKSTTTHFSKRLISYDLEDTSGPSTPITLHFMDGSIATCDILIGADGIHSATRHTLLNLAAQEAESTGCEEGRSKASTLRDLIEPLWSGTVAYRGVIPRERLANLNPDHSAMNVSQNYMGKNKHLIVFPISRGRLVNVVAFCSCPEKEGTQFEGKTVEDRSQEELLSQYKGWEDEVQQLLKCIEKPSRWAINALRPLPIYVHDRVALLGDAAHAMTPHQGSGAGQSIEDAYILATVLTHPLTTLENISRALQIYEEVRLPPGNDVQRRSRENGKIYEFADPRFADLHSVLYGTDAHQANGKAGIPPELILSSLRDLGDIATKNWEWAWTSNPEVDRERAIKLLEEKLRGI